MNRLYGEYNNPERGAMIGKLAYDREAELKKYLASMQFGEGGAYDRGNRTQENIAKMHYGPGGSLDRTTAATVGAHDRQTLAQTPTWAGQGAYGQAQADESKFKLGMTQELRPEALAGARSTYGINTALNQGEMLDKQDAIFKRSNERALALPEHSIPYQKVAPTQDRGWTQKLWQGDLFGTNPMMSDINLKEKLRRKKIAGMNESFLAQEPSYRY